MKKDTVTTNYIYNLLYQIIILVIPLCLTPYLTRILGTENLGIFSYTSSYVILFISFASLGLNIYGQREVAYLQDDIKKRSKLFWELIVIRVFSTIIATVFYGVFVGFSHKYSTLYLFFLPYLLSNMFDITWLYQGMENFKGVAIKTIVIKFLYLISSFVLIKNNNSLNLYIFIFSSAFFLQYLTLWFNLKKYVCKIDIKMLNLKKHFKNIVIFFIPQIATTLYTIMDRTMIGILTDEIDNVYYYEQASYIVKTLVVFVTTLGTVMLSKSSKFFSQRKFNEVKNDLHAIINFVWLFGCALAFGISSIISNIIPWFYGDSYYMIKLFVYIVAILIVVLGLSNILGMQVLIPIKRQNKYTFAVVIGTSINFILNFILIKNIGAIGAAIASVFAEITILLIEVYYARDIIKLKDLFLDAPRYIIYGIIMLIIVNFVSNYLNISILSTLIEIFVGVIVYCTLLLLFKDEFINKYVFSYIKNLRCKNEKNSN